MLSNAVKEAFVFLKHHNQISSHIIIKAFKAEKYFIDYKIQSLYYGKKKNQRGTDIFKFT